MKKLAIILVILLLLAGAGYIVGWLSFRLAPDQVGVVETKSNSVLPQLVHRGNLRWYWQALVPSNVKLHKFLISPRSIQLDFEGTLPSAPVYASMLDPKPDFKYGIQAVLRYSLDEERLISLFKQQSLRPEEIDGYYQTLEAEMTIAIMEEAFDLAKDPETINDNFIKTLNESIDLQSSYPIKVLSFSIQKVDLPDISLYGLAKEMYESSTRARTEAVIAQLVQSASQEAEELLELEILRRLGTVITETPVLLELIKIDPSLISKTLGDAGL
jgi:hypothetical protein